MSACYPLGVVLLSTFEQTLCVVEYSVLLHRYSQEHEVWRQQTNKQISMFMKNLSSLGLRIPADISPHLLGDAPDTPGLVIPEN